MFLISFNPAFVRRTALTLYNPFRVKATYMSLRLRVYWHVVRTTYMSLYPLATGDMWYYTRTVTVVIV